MNASYLEYQKAANVEILRLLRFRTLRQDRPEVAMNPKSPDMSDDQIGQPDLPFANPKEDLVAVISVTARDCSKTHRSGGRRGRCHSIDLSEWSRFIFPTNSISDTVNITNAIRRWCSCR